MSPTNVTQLPNPYTPMAFLPPDSAKQLTLQIYIIIGSLAILIWDILIHLPVDYKLAMKYKINVSFVIYGLSRLTTLTYMIGLAVVSTFPIGNCENIPKFSYIYPFTVSITLLLFVLRTSALYNNNRYVVGFLCMSWLGVLISSIFVPLGVTGNAIANTSHCFEAKTKLAEGLAELPPLLHDSIVFFANSWALSKNSYSDDEALRGKLQAMFLGKYLPTLSKSLLHDGQAYYLATILLGVCTTIAFTLPQSAVGACSFGIPQFVLVHTMSCYVYRNTRLGFYRSCSVSSSFIDKQLHPPDGQRRLEGMEFSSHPSGGRESLLSHPHTNHNNDSRNGTSDAESPDVEKQSL